MACLAPEHRNIVLVPEQRLRNRTQLPLVVLPHDWHEDRLRELLELRLGQKGYRRGIAPPNKGKKFDDYDLPTDAEIWLLIDACSSDRLSGRRDAALIAFLRGTGLRISEACDFRITDLDLEKGKVLVANGKGGKRARCGIMQSARPAAQEWIDDWTAAGFSDPSPLFCVTDGPTKGTRMNPTCFRTKLRQLAEKAGVDKRIHPHCFRHCLAMDMDHRGIPLSVISRQLRHSSVSTTATYLRKVNDDEVFSTLAEMELAL